MIGIETRVVQFLTGIGVIIVAYYVLINIGYLSIHLLALLELRDNVREARWQPPFRPFSSPFYPGVAMVVPAYNEQASIVESIRSMLSLNYPDQEIVVVNDGSTDETMARLRQAFDLQPVDAPIPYDVPTEPIRGVYRSTRHEDLLVVDKENGGKSDALNAGVWLTDQKLFCAVDSDTLIDRNALLQIVRPFLEEPDRAVASGGTIRVANDCEIADGEVQSVHLPKTGLAGLQVMEYLRAFYSGRLGFNRIKGLVLISGAFGVFRTDYVREIGGYRHDTITEDFDIVVRLHQHLTDADIPYRVDFIPEPVAWTEVPETRRVLGRQRRRWYRGMIETAVASRGIFFRPKYGRVGMVILPFFIAAEALGPLIEGLGYILLPLAWFFDILSIQYFLAFFLLTTGSGVFLSWFGIFSEVWSFNRYEDPREIVRLLWYGILENFGYRQWKTIVAWQGLLEYLRGEQSWGVMERRGFGTDTDDLSEPIDGEPVAGDTPVTAASATAGAGSDVSAQRDRIPSDRSAVVATDGFFWGSSLVGNPDDGFIWGSSLVGNPDDGFIWGSSLVGNPDDGFVWGSDLVGNPDDGFVWGHTIGDRDDGVLGDTELIDSPGGGFVWTPDPTMGVGEGGFVWATGLDDDTDTGGFVWTTTFSEGVGDCGLVWTPDPIEAVGAGGFIWTRESDRTPRPKHQ